MGSKLHKLGGWILLRQGAGPGWRQHGGAGSGWGQHGGAGQGCKQDGSAGLGRG